MKRKIEVLSCLFAITMLISTPILNALPGIWLIYDEDWFDRSVYGGTGGEAAVLFDPQPHFTPAQVVAVGISFGSTEPGRKFLLHISDIYHNDLPGSPITVTVPAGLEYGWLTVGLSSYMFIVPDEFLVKFEWTTHYHTIRQDGDRDGGRSFVGATPWPDPDEYPYDEDHPYFTNDLHIRADIQPFAPVPPVAVFTEDAHTVTVGDPISFDASGSYDPDGWWLPSPIVSYDWDFGDGNTRTGVTTSHAYTAAGTYTITLTVTDTDGLRDTATATKHVGVSPPTELIVNGDFETGDFSSWSVWYGTVSVQSNYRYRGSYAALLELIGGLEQAFGPAYASSDLTYYLFGPEGAYTHRVWIRYGADWEEVSPAGISVWDGVNPDFWMKYTAEVDPARAVTGVRIQKIAESDRILDNVSLLGIPMGTVVDVTASDPEGHFSVIIDAGADKGAPVTSWTEISITNIASYTVTLTDGDMVMVIDGQLQDPDLPGQIILQVDPEGEIISYYMNVNPASFELHLSAGWNMVSLPCLPTDHSFSNILNDIGFYQVLTWDGTSYVVPTTAEAGRGYWILVLEDTTLTVTCDEPVESYELDLPPGWSMIGSIMHVHAVDADRVFPGWYQLLTWDGTSYVPITTIEPGRGYWVGVLEETHIVVVRVD